MTETIFSQRSKPANGGSKPAQAAKAPRSAKPPKAPKAPRSKGSKRAESPSLVDPRLQARRIEVARDEGRKRLRWAVVAAVVVGLVVGAYALTQSPLLDVDAVAVKGAARTGQREVAEASGIALGSPMVGVDAPAAERRLEALPWVESATVTREWPGTLQIAVVERTPLAVVGSGSSAVEVDRDGRVLGPASGSDDLPVVAGDAASAGEDLSSTQRWVLDALAGLPSDLRSEVAGASATPSGIRLTLGDDIEVRWGDRSQPTAKADALQVLLEQADRSTIATIDVSVPRAATVTRK